MFSVEECTIIDLYLARNGKVLKFDICRYVVHAQFNQGTLENDIAVVKLKTDVLTDIIWPICITEQLSSLPQVENIVVNTGIYHQFSFILVIFCIENFVTIQKPLTMVLVTTS